MGSARPIWRRVAEHGGVALLLVRHGRTALNADQRFCGGGVDPPLDERGQEQVRCLAERLAGDFDDLYCSPQLRARETAAALAGEREAAIVEALRELDQGVLEGREIPPALHEHAEFFRAWKADPTHVPVPGGESMGALAERVGAAIDSILAGVPTSGGRVITVVGHQMAHAAFVCRALAKPLREWPEFQLRNASANLLVWDRKCWSLLGRNL